MHHGMWGGGESLELVSTRNRTVSHVDNKSPVENLFKWRWLFSKRVGAGQKSGALLLETEWFRSVYRVPPI